MKKYTWGDDPEFFGPQMYYRTSLMLSRLNRYVSRGNVLDAGCGDGVLTFRLIDSGFYVTAVDAAKKCISYLSAKLKRKGLSHSSVAQIADLTKLRYKGNTFDAIVCGEVLEHIKQDTKVIDEFYRVVKDGGICVITTPGKPKMWHEIDDISGHVRRYTREELIRKFEDAGFVVRECSYWGFPINMLWHRLVFKPVILRKLHHPVTVTTSKTAGASIIKSTIIQRVASHIFALDMILNWTGFGEFLFLVAQKPR